MIVVSPAKSLDFESPLATKKFSEPTMLDRSAELVSVMAKKSPDQIGQMMSISPALAELNFERFQEWDPPFTPANARPALLAFSGDVYLGMDAPNSFSERDFTHAQKTLRILSGLYGLLRPLDLIQPYRLEMGSRVKTNAGSDLYHYWGSDIAEALNADIEASPGSNTLINLASNEYFGAVDQATLAHPIVSPAFLDGKDGADYKIVSFFAKRARGVMSAWIIQNRIKSPRALRDFDGMGYRFDPDRSTKARPVFLRESS